MKILGIISEYNPFHNGHLYHLNQAKAITGADYTIAVMSGNFVQRGEPAIVNKWIRAQAALNAGVDLILELPVAYALSSAEYFAAGAVKILDSLGIVDNICFGSESGNIEELQLIADILVQEPAKYKDLLKEHLKKGLSFPAAREEAIANYLNSAEAALLLQSSNNILGIEYLKALKKLKSSIIPVTIKRTANTYNCKYITGAISSATAIRNYINKNSNQHEFEDTIIKNTLPSASQTLILKEFGSERGPVKAENFENIILSELRKKPAKDILKFPYISEGLHNKIKQASLHSTSFEELIGNIANKRHPHTRIQRILFNMMIGITKDTFDLFNQYGPQYIKILGFNENSGALLTAIKKNVTLPIISKPADFKSSCNPLLKKMLELEAISTDLYVLGYNNKSFKKAGQEYTQKIVIHRKKG